MSRAAHCLRKRWPPQAKPVLVIWGQNDPYVGPEYAAAQRRVFPNAQIEVWPNTGHWPHIQQPQRTSETVSAFLRERLSA